MASVVLCNLGISMLQHLWWMKGGKPRDLEPRDGQEPGGAGSP